MIGLLMLERLVTELGMGLSMIGLSMVVSETMSAGFVTEMGLLVMLEEFKSLLQVCAGGTGA